MDTPQKITPNKILAFYFVSPFVLGMLLGNILGLDVSEFMKEYFGVFRFLEAAGKDIQTKSMILLIALIFSPLVWVYLNRLPLDYNDVSTKKIFFLFILGGAIMPAIFFFVAFIGEPSIHVLNEPIRAEKLFFMSISRDIPFGIFCPTIVMACIIFLFRLFTGIPALILRFKL